MYVLGRLMVGQQQEDVAINIEDAADIEKKMSKKGSDGFNRRM